MKKTPYIVTGIVFLALGFLIVQVLSNRAAIEDFRQQNQAERVKALAQITEDIQDTLKEVRRGVDKTLEAVRRLFRIHDPDNFPEESPATSPPPNDPNDGRRGNDPPKPPTPKPSPTCILDICPPEDISL